MKTDITFILLSVIILFGIGSYMLIIEYGTIPQKVIDENYMYGLDHSRKLEKQPDFWTIDFKDQRISNIEHIIIFLCLFLGFLRLIDLIFVIEDDKKRYRWAYFFEYLERNHNC